MSYQIKRKRKYKEKNKVNLNLQAMILLKRLFLYKTYHHGNDFTQRKPNKYKK